MDMILVHEPKEFKERYNWSCLHREPRAVSRDGKSRQDAAALSAAARSDVQRCAGWQVGPPSGLRPLRRHELHVARPASLTKGNAWRRRTSAPSFCVVASLGRRL